MRLANILAQKQNAMTVSEVADLLQISDRLVYQMAAEGKIPSFKVRGTVRFDPHILSHWVSEMVDAPAPPVKTLVPSLYEAPASEAEDVCAEAYQLVGHFMRVIPNATQWLDNLAQGRLVHEGLLPVFKTDEDVRVWRAALLELAASENSK
jgi:excisionase family DNA binding protein